MALRYKNERIQLERVSVFTGWKDFAVEGNQPKARQKSTLLGQVWGSPDRSLVNVSVTERCDRISFEEAVKMDYHPTSVGTAFGKTWATFWFRLDILLPEDSSHKTYHLIWDSESEAMVWNADGMPLQGLCGDSGMCRRMDFEIPRSSTRNQRLYVEMACNQLFGAGRDGLIEPPDPERTFTLKECGISVFNESAWHLLQRLTFLEGCATHLPKAYSRRAEALEIANKVVNAVVVEDESTWPRGEELIDGYLSSGGADHKPFSKATVYAIGHCHIDTAWLWPYDETIRKCARSWSTQISLMKKYPDYIFVCSQAQQMKWVKERYPKLYDEIREWVQRKQFVITGGTWVEMDCNLCSGESLIRQLLYGHKFFQEEFQVKCDVLWLPDTFGYSSQLPQIMHGAGIDYFLTQKLSWNLFNKFPHSIFRWEGLDDSYNASGNVDEVLRTMNQNKDNGIVDSSMLLFGHGDGGGGANPAMLDSLSTMQPGVEGLPNIVMKPPSQFFSEAKVKADELPKWVGELYFELHRGTYTSQAKIKAGNRRCELELRAADIFLVCAHAFDESHPSNAKPDLKVLNSCWEDLLLHQFHDTLPGSCIQSIIERAESDHISILKRAGEVLEATKSTLAKHLHARLTPSSSDVKPSSRAEERRGTKPVRFQAYFICNPHTFAREEVFEVQDLLESMPHQGSPTSGGKLFVLYEPTNHSIGTTVIAKGTTHDVPHGATCYTCDDGSIMLQNQHVQVQVSQGGRISSLRLHGDRKVPEIISSSQKGNQFVLYDDISLFWDAWDVEAYNFEKSRCIYGAYRFEINEAGPLYASVTFWYELSDKSTLNQTISISCVSPLVTFETEVSWWEHRKMLRVEFPTTIRSSVASYETQFGFLQRPTHANTSWDAAKFEVCGHRYADLSETNYGLALLNDSKYGYSVRDGVMRLSLLRSPKSPDPDCDMGNHKFTYALLPHSGSFPNPQVVREAIRLNQPIQIQTVEVDASSPDRSENPFFWIENPDGSNTYDGAVILDAVKFAEDGSGDVFLRLYESLGGTEDIRIAFSTKRYRSAKYYNMIETKELHDRGPLHLVQQTTQLRGTSEECQNLTVTFRPFQIITIKLAP